MDGGAAAAGTCGAAADAGGKRRTKYVAVTGGVVSGLGKGITISSIGRLLKQSGLRVTAIKIDPYLNTDAGTMSPFEHGEVFVLNDGGEVRVPGCIDIGISTPWAQLIHPFNRTHMIKK